MSESTYPNSRYAARLGDIPPCPSLQKVENVDVCVIGAGLAGLTTAVELLKLGKSVVVLESGRVAIAASGRNGGFVAAGFAQSIDTVERRVGLQHAQKLYLLSQAGADYVHQTIMSSTAPTVIEGRGKLSVSRTDNMSRLRQQTDQFNQKYQQNLQVWQAEDLQQNLMTNRYFAATHDAGGFHIDPLRYALLLRGQIAALGGAIFEQSPAVSLTQSGGGWTVSSRKGRVNCQSVALCQNIDDHRIYPKLARAVLPVATYVISLNFDRAQLDQAILFDGTIADSRRAGDYYRRVENSLIWGGRITTRRSQPSQLANTMVADMVDVYPQLAGVEPSYCWQGLMGYTVHLMPIIGELQTGIWVAAGFGGHGLNTTAMAGNLIAAGISGSDDQWRLFEPFRARWGGGMLGRAATQSAYWWMQWRDRRDERLASK
jgi:glycine/D-amino acid oxidase-like deaminating enzyme